MSRVTLKMISLAAIEVLLLYLFVYAGAYRRIVVMARMHWAAFPDFWPRAFLLVLMVCVALEGRRSIASGVASKRADASGALRVFSGVFLLFAYVILAEYLGFTLVTFIFIFVFCWLAGVRKPIPIVTVSAITLAVIHFAFTRVLYVPLPKGVGPFYELSVIVEGLFRG